MTTPALLLSIPSERLEAIVREEIAAALDAKVVLAWRREFLLQLATISAEEGGVLVGVSKRFFRATCERLGVPVANLSHKHPRYRIVDVSAKLDEITVAARKDLTAARQRMAETIQTLLRELDALNEAAGEKPPALRAA